MSSDDKNNKVSSQQHHNKIITVPLTAGELDKAGTTIQFILRPRDGNSSAKEKADGSDNIELGEKRPNTAGIHFDDAYAVPGSGGRRSILHNNAAYSNDHDFPGAYTHSPPSRKIGTAGSYPRRMSVYQDPMGYRASRFSRRSLAVPAHPTSVLSMGEAVGGDMIPEMTEEEEARDPITPYGWWIVAACSSIASCSIGMTYLWGIYQAKLEEEGLANSSTLSYVGSITMTCISLFGILNAWIMTRIGVRNCAIIGSLTFCSGIFFCGFSTKSVIGLIFLNGFLQGYGVSMLFLTFSTLPAQYFTKRKGTAVGIIYCCGGLGGAVFGIIIDQLIEKIGVAWCFRITGLISLGLTLPAAFFCKERARRTAPFIDWSLYKNKLYIILNVLGFFGTFSLLGPPFLATNYAVAVGTSATTGAYLVSLYNLSSAAGRLFFGYAADKVGAFNSLFLDCLLIVLSLLALWPVADTIPPFVIFMIVNGFASGGYFSVMPSVALAAIGSEKITTAYGMFLTTWGPGYLLGAPISGYLLAAAYGSSNTADAPPHAYRTGMWFSGGCALMVLCLVLLLNMTLERQEAQRIRDMENAEEHEINLPITEDKDEDVSVPNTPTKGRTPPRSPAH